MGTRQVFARNLNCAAEKKKERLGAAPGQTVLRPLFYALKSLNCFLKLANFSFPFEMFKQLRKP